MVGVVSCTKLIMLSFTLDQHKTPEGACDSAIINLTGFAVPATVVYTEADV